MNKIYLLSNYSCVDGDEKITNYAFTTKELAQSEMRRQIANANLYDLELDYDTETAVSYVEHGYYEDNHEDWAIQELSVIDENIITHELCTSVYPR